jgi:hypothetical protein
MPREDFLALNRRLDSWAYADLPHVGARPRHLLHRLPAAHQSVMRGNMHRLSRERVTSWTHHRVIMKQTTATTASTHFGLWGLRDVSFESCCFCFLISGLKSDCHSNFVCVTCDKGADSNSSHRAVTARTRPLLLPRARARGHGMQRSGCCCSLRHGPWRQAPLTLGGRSLPPFNLTQLGKSLWSPRNILL